MSPRLPLLAVLAALLPGLVRSQQTFSAAGASASLRGNGASARALALGGAFVGLADDSAALYFNPAGLAGLGRTELAMNHHSWIAGIYEEQGVLATGLGRAGALGLGLDYTDFGAFEGRGADGAPAPGYGAHRLGGSLAWALKPWSRLSVGLEAAGFREQLAGSDATSFSGGLGLLWEPWHGTRLGLAAQDLGASVNGAPVASPIRAGLSQAFHQGGILGALISASGDFEPAGVSHVSAGVELDYRAALMLRAGYRLDLAEQQVEGLRGASAGVGFRLGQWRLDYAYLPYGELGASQRISLVCEMGRAPVAVKPDAAEAKPVPGPGPTPAPTPAVPAGGSALNLQFSLPADPYAHARELQSQGRSSEAVSELQGMIRANGGDVRAWRMLADLYRGAGFKAYAISSYEQVLRLRPDPALKDWLEQYRAAPGPTQP